MFKIGDIVEVVDNSGSYDFRVGEICEVDSIDTSHPDVLIKVVGKDSGMFAFRFKLHKEKQMKLKDIIKPFMRVRTRSEGVWIAVERSGETFLVKGKGFNNILEAGEYGNEEYSLGYDIMEVYDAPEYIHDYLNHAEHGKSIWTLPTPKSSQQLAQESAVAELEASIKTSQDKLAVLKLSLVN